MECVYGKRDDRKFHIDNESVRCSSCVWEFKWKWFYTFQYSRMEHLFTLVVSIFRFYLLLNLVKFPSNIDVYDFTNNNAIYSACMEIGSHVLRNSYSFEVCKTRASFTFTDTNNHVHHCIGSNKWTTNRINVVYIYCCVVECRTKPLRVLCVTVPTRT